MALTKPITRLDSYRKYLNLIGVVPSYLLDKCFACGLPAVWLYMKSIGLESEYFDLIKKVKDRPLLFKELFYLLLLTNGTNKFFPRLPNNFLKIEIPAQMQAALIQVNKPEFDMAFSFSREQLKETLQMVAKPNKMIRIGNTQQSIGIMFQDNVYHVYHADNPSALQFKNIDSCVDLIIRVVQ